MYNSINCIQSKTLQSIGDSNPYSFNKVIVLFSLGSSRIFQQNHLMKVVPAVNET